MKPDNREQEGGEAAEGARTTDEGGGAGAQASADLEDVAGGNGAAEPSSAAGEPSVAESEALVSRREFDDLQERYLRLAAEYDNFRKRTDRERLEQRDRAQGQIVQQLLEGLDDLERVAGLDPGGTTVESVLEGVRLVERKILRALETAGLETVPARGEKFDPEHHEALMLSGTSEPDEDDTVGDVFQTGYRFRGTLLRPARVQVKKLEA